MCVCVCVCVCVYVHFVMRKFALIHYLTIQRNNEFSVFAECTNVNVNSYHVIRRIRCCLETNANPDVNRLVKFEIEIIRNKKKLVESKRTHLQAHGHSNVFTLNLNVNNTAT